MDYRNDFKVRFNKEPQYFVDFSNRTVRCYLSCDVIVPTFLSKNGIMYNFRIWANAQAKCCDEDLFKPNVGKKIALARAENKIYSKVASKVDKLATSLDNFLTATFNFIEKADGVIEHNENYIKRISENDSNKKDGIIRIKINRI